MLLAEGSTLTTGEGGLIGVVVLAVLGLLGIVLQVRRDGKNSNSAERNELMKQFRAERDAAVERADEAEAENDRLRTELLAAQGRAQLAELEKQRGLDRIEDLTAEITRLRKAVEKTLPDPPEENHGPTLDIA